MSISPSLDIFSVQLATIKSNTLSIPVAIKNKENKTVEIPALINSGAGGIFIDQNYTKNSNLPIQKLDKPLVTQNIDNTENKHGKITSFVELNLTVNRKNPTNQTHVGRIGKTKNHPWFPMAKWTKSWYWLENQEIHLATSQTLILDQKERSWKTTPPTLSKGISLTNYEKPNNGRRERSTSWTQLNPEPLP